MRSWNAAGVAAGALLGFLPAAVVLLPHGGRSPAPAAARLAAAVREPTAARVAAAIHAQIGRQAYCHAWPGHRAQFWCSAYGGTRCFYALFELDGTKVSVNLPTASRIPCKSGQYDLHATPGRDT